MRIDHEQVKNYELVGDASKNIYISGMLYTKG